MHYPSVNMNLGAQCGTFKLFSSSGKGVHVPACVMYVLFMHDRMMDRINALNPQIFMEGGELTFTLCFNFDTAASGDWSRCLSPHVIGYG